MKKVAMPSSKKNSKNWSGRFNEPVDELVQRYTASISFDHVLAPYDIKGSLAHAQMLQEKKIISKKDFSDIKKGMSQISSEISSGSFKWSIEKEDIHLNIEHRLTQLIGDAGKKLHTARSRNDQVATDIRLYLRDVIDEIVKLLSVFQGNLLNLAEKHVDTVMPGFTHLQVAQPVSLGHHLMAYFEMTNRDKARFSELRKRVNRLPLGSGALAGTTFTIDRARVAKLLNFDGICENSLDAVSDRDFAIEFCSNASLLMMHFSRLSEEIILWMSQQFGFVKLADRFCTGSSMMPQKKNPDVPELVRGKTGRTYGHLMSLLTLMKGQPLAYNKDNQEDKEPLFDCARTVLETLTIYADLIKGIEVDASAMEAAAARGYSTATDLADELVRLGVPFRESHEIVARAVQHAEKLGVDLSNIPPTDAVKIDKRLTLSVLRKLTLTNALRSRNHSGGTSPAQVKRSIASARRALLKN